MKNTREKVLKLLEEVMRNSSSMLSMWEEEGDEKMAAFYYGEKMALLFAIGLLQDNEYFIRVYKMYFKGEENHEKQKRKEDI